MAPHSDHHTSPGTDLGDDGDDQLSHSDPLEQDEAYESQQPPRKRQRIRLSCLECRRRKLSCDRDWPCSRCRASGTPEKCEYETRPGLAPPNRAGLLQGSLTSGLEARLSVPVGSGEPLYRKESARETERLRRLELEVSQLKNLLLKQAISLDGSTVHTDGSPNQVPSKDPPPDVPCGSAFMGCHQADSDKDELRFFRGKEFKTRYFGPHNAYMAFSELTGLCPFMKQTADEWLRPHVINRKEGRAERKAARELQWAAPDLSLEALLPTQLETDALVSLYLSQFEQIHRIVHVPSFRREYAKFWDPMHTRQANFTALVLSITSITCCVNGNTTGKFVGLVSHSHHTAEKWIKACDDWLAQQSQKHRRLAHYQIAALLYLAKRVNIIKKKRFWKSAGALVQDGISVGLHRDPSQMTGWISEYNQEMKRRIWATLQEFDLQAGFDYGLPSILCSLPFDVNAPSNLNDEDFDEDTVEVPPSKPVSEYTEASYQHVSRQSLPLRLELSRLLSGRPGDINYDQVIHYTNEITQEIDTLPSWDVTRVSGPDGSRKPLLAYTLLHIQLRQYLIPLHQPYLKLRKTNSKYQYSEIVYYNAARDMVLLHDKLAEQGIRTLNFLREDALTLCINLCNVTILQPRGSTNMIMVNSDHTQQLMEKCLAMKEDRIVRCGNAEPWSYSIMCSALGLLEAHLGAKSAEVAKASSAERFVNFHCRMLSALQDAPPSSQQSELGKLLFPPGSDPVNRAKSVTPFFASQVSTTNITGATEVPMTPWWASADSTAQPDFNLDMLGMNLNELWGDSWDFS